ncbi:juvenile hormone esterase-like isoform X2 [Frankliniella occidentalis]|uniref:Carboxylic ester hydrolase n=1 Tax=Frankliniella occidentalis TaxID=133901 RepID=A0A9C6X1V3_FRAOC|nr:juvenile hormone esterase-like isoform X2 [Frankliniella occidentalis]
MRILQVMCALSLAIRGTNPILFASHKWQRGVSSAGFDPSNRRPHRAEAPENPEVSVEQGRLLGRTLVSSKGTKYHAFSGIPYAAPPIGDLRFKAPRPPAAWAGLRDARREGRICTQPLLNLTRIVTRVPRTIEPLHGDELPGLWRARPWLLQVVTNILSAGEDCLFVNVYTPQSALGKDAGGGKGLPVLFWIYGGGFVWGEGGRAFYDPDLLIDHGMVVVTFNYRLGPLGFLSLGRGSGVPGNAGVKDQRAALHWVRRNIAAFGGDPDKITVYGESAGAVCTHLHLLSPSTKGLFRGAIMSSGSAAHFWATETAAKAARRARHFAPAVNCKGNLPARELVRCLRNVRPQTLVAFHEKSLLPEDLRFITGRVPFVPVIEETEEVEDASEEPIITESPLAMLSAGKQAKVPTLMGFNSGEALIIFSGLTRDPSVESLRLADRNITCLVPDDVLPHLSLAEAEEMGHRVRRLYMGHEKPITLANKNDDKFFEMITSFFIYLDTLKLARFLAADPTAAPLYIYRFEYVGALNTFRNLLRIQTKAACHADELNYVWRVNVSPDSRTLKPNATEYKVRDMFSTMLANFVKTGSPTPRGSPLDPRLSWPPFTAMEQAYMSIDKEPRVERNYRRDIIGFWDAIFAERVGGPIWTKIVGMEERRRAVLDTQTNLVHGGHQRIAPKSTRRRHL